MKIVEFREFGRVVCRLLSVTVLGFMFVGCQSEHAEDSQVKSVSAFDQDLVDELGGMVELDQVAAGIPQGEHEKMSEAEWAAFKGNTFETHRQRLEVMFRVHGFVGYDKGGKDGSDDFWLLTQHCDHAPEFQLRVLEKMKVDVAKDNASADKYAMLVDRVNLNLGTQQIYGTQVAYDLEICQAYSRDLANKAQVNRLRKQVGLTPLEVYLNEMSEMHFAMNQGRYLKLGITEPKLYLVD